MLPFNCCVFWVSSFFLFHFESFHFMCPSRFTLPSCAFFPSVSAQTWFAPPASHYLSLPCASESMSLHLWIEPTRPAESALGSEPAPPVSGTHMYNTEAIWSADQVSAMFRLKGQTLDGFKLCSCVFRAHIWGREGPSSCWDGAGWKKPSSGPPAAEWPSDYFCPSWNPSASFKKSVGHPTEALKNKD